MKAILMSLLYSSLLVIFCLVDVFKWLLSLLQIALTKLSKKPVSSKIKRDWQWGQKFGLLSTNLLPKTNEQMRFVIHCASMGEVVAAMPMAIKLLETDNRANVVITTNTLTGKQQFHRMCPADLAPRLQHCYLPIDLPWLMASFTKSLQPNALIIMEVELWPNLIKQMHKRDVPIVIVNARLTDKTANGYRKFSTLTEPMMAAISFVFARNDNDFRNYQSFGFRSERLIKAGNIKFDIALPDLEQPQQLRQSLKLQDKLVLVAGSTHPGEEQLVVDAYKQFKQQIPNLILLIVPRHPHRFDLVAEQLQSNDLAVSRMSLAQEVTQQTDVLLGDQMGQLSRLYGVADVVFVGGSFAKVGGHNPIEPAAFAKPILMGQHIYNNPEICQTIADNGGLTIFNNQYEFTSQLNALLSEQTLRVEQGQKALATIEQNQGVMALVVNKLFEFVSTP